MTKQFGPSKDFPPLTEPSSKPMFKYNIEGAGGVVTFIELEDTPSFYTGYALCVPIVNAGENRLDFISFSHSLLSGTHNLTSDIDHNQLTNYEASEHIKWNITGAEKIHVDRLDLAGLSSPDDDFYNNLTLAVSIQDTDQLLIADASDSFNYKKVTRATLVSGLGTVQKAYYRVVSDTGLGNMDATGEDLIHIKGDGSIIETFGVYDGANKLSLVFKNQSVNRFLAGPSSGLPDIPTFRSLLAADMPTGYNSSQWDIAYSHSQTISGNPHGVEFSDLGGTIAHSQLTGLDQDDHAGVYETVLGNPGANGYVLSSTTSGVRSWIEMTVDGVLSAVTVNAINNVDFTITGAADILAVDFSHNHAGVYEPVLGNPVSDGYVLSSTAVGVRSWIPVSTFDSRYYTKTESDARFVQVAGDTMTGTLIVPSIKITTGAADGYYLRSDTSGNGTWAAITASQVYKGTWNASTNTPTLADGTGTAGWYYRVTVAGTVNLGSGNITFSVGDDVSYNGTIWERIPAATITGMALTRTNDTNITLTLGGSPSTALVNAASITVGWQGTLADSRIASSSSWNIAYDERGSQIAGTRLTWSTGQLHADAANIAQGTRTTTTVPITSSTGNNATLQAATTSLAGVMTAADKTNLDTLYTIIGLSALTAAEVNQLENIGTTTISSTQWGYLGAMTGQPLEAADLSGYAQLGVAQTFTAKQTFNSGSYDPLVLDRTATNNVNILFKTEGTLRGYLGTNDSGDLKWGINANSAGNPKIYHAGNSNLSTVDWVSKNLVVNGIATISGPLPYLILNDTTPEPSPYLVANGGIFYINFDTPSTVGKVFSIDAAATAVFYGSVLAIDSPTSANIYLDRGNNTSYQGVITFRDAGINKWILGQRLTGGNTFSLYSYGTGKDVLSIDYSSGEVEVDNFKLNNIRLDESFDYDNAIYFTPQAYFEAESPTAPSGWTWIIDGFEKENNIDVPFSQVAKSSSYDQLYSDFIPVQAGETLYGEMWAMRDVGATGTAGNLYYGIQRYDKDKQPIASNNGTIYFVASAMTVPTTGVWTKYSGTHTLLISHIPYNGSDGGPVRYVRVRILVNYNAGTIPTHWGGILLRRAASFRDAGDVIFNGSITLNNNLNFNNTNTQVYKDGSGNLTFKDSVTGVKTLAQLAAGVSSMSITNPGDYKIVTSTSTSDLLQGESLLTWDGSKLGVGTTSPATPLEVSVNDANNNTVTEVLRVSHMTTGTAVSGIGAGIGFVTERSSGSTVLAANIKGILTDVSAVDSALLFETRTAAGVMTEQMRITDTGRVGINTGGPPSTRLHVKETSSTAHGLRVEVTANSASYDVIQAYRNTTEIAHLDSTGDWYAGDIAFQSDPRLKNVEDTPVNGLNIALKLNPVFYKWKDGRNDFQHIGFLTTDVEKVRPELVKKGGEYDSLSYSRISAINTSAIQELYKEIQELKLEIKKLKNGTS